MKLLNKKILLLSCLVFLFGIKTVLSNDYYQSGKIAFYQKDYYSARALFKKALIQSPDNTNCRYYLAQTLIHLDKINEAQKEYQKIIEDSPKSAAAKLSIKGLALIEEHKIQAKKIRYNGESNIANMSQKLIDYLLSQEARSTYINNAPTSSGLYVRWENLSQRPLKIYVLDGTNTKGYQPYYRQEMNNALAAWKAKLGDLLSYSIVNNKEDADIVISYSDNLTGKAADKSYLLGLTQPFYKENTLNLVTMKMLTQKSEGESISPELFYTTFLHEFGHALGIQGHSNSQDDIMTSVVQSSSKADRKQISPRDLATIKMLYKIPSEYLKENNADSISSKTYLKQEKLKEAIEYVKKAPNVAISWRSLGDAYYGSNEYNKAIENYKKALLMSPNDISALEGLAKTYKTTKSDYDAVAALKQLVNIVPTEIKYAIELSKLYLSQQRQYDAKQVIDSLIQNNPNALNNKEVIEIKSKIN